MDTLSSSVSALKVSAFPSTPRELYHFKTPNPSHHLRHPHPHQLSTTKHNSISTKTSFFTHKSLSSSSFSSSHVLSAKPSPYTHRKPASGYAAALADVGQHNSSLEDIQQDVRRLSRLLRNQRIQTVFLDPFVGDKEKGQIIKEVTKKGKFNCYLVGLLKILIERNKVGMIGEVLQEFERIYDEMIGTKVVLVSSAKKMEEDELFGIAKRVQKLTGAVKVKVRNLVDERLPAFAL